MSPEIVDRNLLIDELSKSTQKNQSEKFEVFQVKERYFVFIVNTSLLIEINDLIFTVLNQFEYKFSEIEFGSISTEDLLGINAIIKIIGNTTPTSVCLAEARKVEGKRYFINPHSTCNLECAYCFTKIVHATKFRTAPKQLEETKYFIDKAMKFIQRDSRGQTKVHIHYSIMGEPLLDLDGLKYLCQKTDEARNETGVDYWISILTNGILLNQETVNWVHSKGIFLGISIDGSEEIQNQLRPCNNGLPSYNILAANLKKVFAKNWGEFPPGATVTLTSLNTAVDEIFMHLYSVGFRIINFQRVRLNRSNNLAITKISQEAINESYARLVGIFIQDAKSGSIERLKCIICREEPLAIAIFCLLNQKGFYYRCPMYIDGYRSINADGLIYSCSSMTGDSAFQIGHIESETCQGKGDLFMQSVLDHAPCVTCWAKYICGGPCLHSSYIEYGEFDKIVDESCDSIKFLIKLGSYLLAELTEYFPESIPLLEDIVVKRFL